MENSVILRTVARIYVQWSASTTEEKEKFQKLRKEQQGTQCSNWEEISEVYYKQEKEENRKRAPALARNADFRQ